MSLLTLSSRAQSKRARDHGVPLEGMPGAWNAIIDGTGMAGPNWVAILLQCIYGIKVEDKGSILIAVATDAPLPPNQTERRASPGLAWLGATSDNGSVFMLPNDPLAPIFEATVEAAEETKVNALLAAEGVAGVDCQEVTALLTNRRRESHPG